MRYSDFDGSKRCSDHERKIVVAVDESEESMNALSWCISNLILGSHQDHNQTRSSPSSEPADENRIILLYVKPRPTVYTALDVPGYIFGGDVVAAMEEHTKELVDSVMGRADAVFRKSRINVKVEKKVASGEAKDVICECVKELGADILVMGSHGYGFFKRAVLGSVSNYCAKYAECPVVVIKSTFQC